MPLGSSREVRFNRPNDVARRNEVHTSREVANRIDTEMLRLVLLVTVAQGHASRPPAAARGTAGQLANGVKKSMSRILLPGRWFASPGDHDARTNIGFTRLALHGSREVHQQRDRAQDSLGMIDEPDQLAKRGAAA